MPLVFKDRFGYSSINLNNGSGSGGQVLGTAPAEIRSGQLVYGIRLDSVKTLSKYGGNFSPFAVDRTNSVYTTNGNLLIVSSNATPITTATTTTILPALQITSFYRLFMLFATNMNATITKVSWSYRELNQQSAVERFRRALAIRDILDLKFLPAYIDLYPGTALSLVTDTTGEIEWSAAYQIIQLE